MLFLFWMCLDIFVRLSMLVVSNISDFCRTFLNVIVHLDPSPVFNFQEDEDEY